MSPRSVLFCIILLAIVPALPVQAATCLSGGCHQQIVASKYLHGPIAAEQSGKKGCVACHVPTGRQCAANKAGTFKPLTPSVKMCQLCHAKGTGTQHSVKKIDCLKCHDPHGSDHGIDLQRR